MIAQLYEVFIGLCTSAAATVELQTISILKCVDYYEQTKDRLSGQLLLGWKLCQSLQTLKGNDQQGLLWKGKCNSLANEEVNSSNDALASWLLLPFPTV